MTIPRAALPGWKAFGLLLGIQIVLDLLVLTESPLVLYPLAIISCPGCMAPADHGLYDRLGDDHRAG